MKTTDKKELQAKSKVELQKLVQEGYNTLGQLRLDHAQNKLKNTSMLSVTRKKIAIIKSFIQQKQEKTEGEEK